MRVINFLPDDYRQRISARRANLVCVLIAGGSLLVLCSMVALSYVQAKGAAGLRVIVERQYEEANRQVAQAKQLEDRKNGLLHKVDLSTALLDRVPASRLIATMTNYLPPDTSLTSVTMRVEEVEANLVSADAKKPSADAPRKTLGNRNATPAAGPAKIKRVVFRIDGLAQTDVQVAEFLGRVGADPLFEEVDLQFTESFPYKEGLTLRRFQVTFRLSPNADKVMDMSTEQKALTAAAAEQKALTAAAAEQKALTAAAAEQKALTTAAAEQKALTAAAAEQKALTAAAADAGKGES